jgi:hypothetical protein
MTHHHQQLHRSDRDGIIHVLITNTPHLHDVTINDILVQREELFSPEDRHHALQCSDWDRLLQDDRHLLIALDNHLATTLAHNATVKGIWVDETFFLPDHWHTAHECVDSHWLVLDDRDLLLVRSATQHFVRQIRATNRPTFCKAPIRAGVQRVSAWSFVAIPVFYYFTVATILAGFNAQARLLPFNLT